MGGVSGVAGALAPFVGGWLLDVSSWRSVFVVNVPLAVVVIWLALMRVPESRDGGAADGLDWARVLPDCHPARQPYLRRDRPRSLGGDLVERCLARRCGGFLLRAGEGGASCLNPVLPLGLFRVREFAVANVVTFFAYGAIAVYFLVLTLQLQVVSGWTPLAAGLSTVPVVVLTLFLSRRSGRLAQRIGPRPQLTLGPLLCGAGALLALLVGEDASYVRDVLPGVLVFGLGLAVMVAPLTATALGSVPVSHAGVASGVNTAVARTAALLALAAVPVLAGLTGTHSRTRSGSTAALRSPLACAPPFSLPRH